MTDGVAPLDIQRLRGELAGARFGDLRWVAVTGSTNDDVLTLAREGVPAGAVLVADHQMSGRGRLGRSWEAPPGASLLLSILIRPAAPPLALAASDLHLVSTAVGLAAAEAISSQTAVDVRLKWPNDLVVEDPGAGTRKLSGLLAETIIEGDHVSALVVGIGINVNWPADIPPELADIAIALNHLTGAPVDRGAVLVDLLRRLDAWYSRLATDDGRQSLMASYRERSATIGRRVRVDLAGREITGTAIDIGDDGLLRVIDDAGVTVEITAGDVVHVRTGV